MFLTKATCALLPWLSLAIGFSALAPRRPRAARPNPAARPLDRRHRRRRADGSPAAAVALRLSQSINDDVGGFHYDQEPRGASFMSQVSKRDLWERRQNRRGPPRRRRRPPPASRGAYYRPNDGRGVDYGSDGNGVVDVEASPSEFDEFKEDVSANLGAMTELLREMQRSQSAQSTDVQALSMKVAGMVDRLGVTEAKNRMVNGNHSPGYSVEDKNFGTSLDGEFNQKIKDVIDEFDRVNYNTGYGVGQQGDYRSTVAQLENRINRIDETLQATEEKLDSQMEYVDRVLDGVVDDGYDGYDGSFDGMRFRPHPPPSESFLEEPFMEERPQPPLSVEERPPPPPPPGASSSQQSFENNNENSYYDDGTQYYQERNHNDPFNPPPRMQEIPSNQNARSNSDSANERSGGFHYQRGNASFISAFSKASNEDQRRFDPFGGARRGNAASVREQLPRGAPPRMGGYGMRAPGPVPPRYDGAEEPYFYEGDRMMDGPMMDGPMMDGPMDGAMMDGPMMGGDYYYDGMHEFDS